VAQRGLAAGNREQCDCREEGQGEGCWFWDGGDAEIEGVGLHFEDARHAGGEADVVEVGGCEIRAAEGEELIEAAV
jgi:hypothetical protein